MCYQCGSPEQATNPCPMCKVFVHPKCPHRREICRNRITHPRFDVLFLTNAEVESFNGCGYCKWARHNNLNKEPLYDNPGWPGCCRAPKPSEYRYISVVDWASVSVIYDISIPPEIKTTLDSFNALSPTSLSTSKSRRGTGKSANRRNNANTMHPEKVMGNGGSGGSGSGHPSRTNSFSKEKGNERVRGGSGGSPQQIAVALTNLSLSRSVSSSPRSQSSVIPTLTEHHQNHHQVHKRPPIPDFSSDKRGEGTHSEQSSPTRNNAQLENVTIDTNASALNKMPSVRRHTTPPGTSGVLPSPISTASSKIADGSTKQQHDGSSKRRSTFPTAPVIATSASGSVTVTKSPAPDSPLLSRRKEDEVLANGSKSPNSSTRNSNTSPSTRLPLKLPNLSNVQQHSLSSPSTRSSHPQSFPSLSSSVPASPLSPHSSGSSDSGSSDSGSGSGSGSGSLSDCTIISEGFTDYLSEESEAELQRQAEERAAKVALVAQTQAEEMEFRAARLKLASVDLRPPKAWVGGVQGAIGNSGGSGNGSNLAGVNVKTPSGSTRVKASPTHVHGVAANPSASLGRTFASRQSVSGARV